VRLRTAIVPAAVAALGLPAPATASAQAEVDARAGNVWVPDDVAVDVGGDVTWRFDHPDNSALHDVWLVPPGGNPDPPTEGGDLLEVTDGPVDIGGDPVSYTFNEEGSWAFVCRIHSFQSGGSGTPWTGMVGEVDVGPPPPPTELDLGVKPRKQTVKPGRKATFTATVENVGVDAASQVKVCAKAPKKLVAVKGERCASFESLEPAASEASKFKFKPKKKAKGKRVKIRFTATASNAPTETASATLKVRRR
jgi:uncharacterized repeat protein (TIGR01451 family)